MSEEKYAVFNVEGGLGKVIASTAIAETIKNNFPDRKVIVVTPWPEVYMNNPFVYRVFRSGNHSYFYRDYINGKDTLIFKNEPYFTTEHVHKKRHIILSWCDIFKLEYKNERPQLFFNSRELETAHFRFTKEKPLLILQTNGGMLNHQKPYCWSRDLPIAQAADIANALKDKFHIMHVTRPACFKLKDTEVVPEMTKREFLSMLTIPNSKRILIDSCLQHAAAALNLTSTVCWVTTSPKTFGYGIHTNVITTVERPNEHLIDSFIFDYDFNGNDYEYPFASNQLFDVDAIIKSVTT